MNQTRGEWPSWGACLRIGATVLVVFLLIRYWGSFESLLSLVFAALSAIVAGLAIAYLINIPMRLYERHIPRGLALVAALATVIGAVLAVAAFVLPPFIECGTTFVKNLPSIVQSLLENPHVKAIVPEDMAQKALSISWDELADQAAAWLQIGSGNLLPRVASIAANLGTLGLGFIFSIWFLADKEHLCQLVHRMVRMYLGERADERFRNATALLDECFHRYIIGQLLEACIMGGLMTVGALVLRLPYPVMIGALVGIFWIIPIVGMIASLVVGTLMILTISWQKAIMFAVLLIVVQQIEGNFIYPNVVGRMVRLDALWTLLGVTVGTMLLGAPGAFVGVPLTAALHRVVSGDLHRREAEAAGGAGQ